MECEARYLLSFDLEERRRRLSGIEKKRSKEAVEKLKQEIVRQFNEKRGVKQDVTSFPAFK